MILNQHHEIMMLIQSTDQLQDLQISFMIIYIIVINLLPSFRILIYNSALTSYKNFLFNVIWAVQATQVLKQRGSWMQIVLLVSLVNIRAACLKQFDTESHTRIWLCEETCQPRCMLLPCAVNLEPHASYTQGSGLHSWD